MNDEELQAWRAAIMLCRSHEALSQVRNAIYAGGVDPDDQLIAMVREQRLKLDRTILGG